MIVFKGGGRSNFPHGFGRKEEAMKTHLMQFASKLVAAIKAFIKKVDDRLAKWWPMGFWGAKPLPVTPVLIEQGEDGLARPIGSEPVRLPDGTLFVRKVGMPVEHSRYPRLGELFRGERLKDVKDPKRDLVFQEWQGDNVLVIDAKSEHKKEFLVPKDRLVRRCPLHRVI